MISHVVDLLKACYDTIFLKFSRHCIPVAVKCTIVWNNNNSGTSNNGDQ